MAQTVMLVIEEPFVRDLIAANLRSAGCFPLAVQSVTEGKRLAAQIVPDVIVVDIDNLSMEDCAWPLEVARASEPGRVRTAMLSSHVLEACGADGARCGASLCVSKPFEPRELMARLLRLLRPPREAQPRARFKPPLRLPALELEREEPTVRVLQGNGWMSLDLTWTEHRLLEFLMSDPTRVRSREAIRDAVWSDTSIDLRSVDQYVRRLRRSLQPARAGEVIKTIKSVGYRLQLEALGATVGQGASLATADAVIFDRTSVTKHSRDT